MKIIDGQIHIFEPAQGFPKPVAALSVHGDLYTAEMALAQLDAANVQAAVLMGPGWMAPDNAYVLAAAAKYPDRFAVMGYCDFDAEDVRQQLDNWRDTPGMVGIRVSQSDPRSLAVLTENRYGWFWDRCEALDIPLMCYMPGKAKAIGAVAERRPGLRITIDHAGRHARGPKDDAAWHDVADLLELATCPNVAVKVSSLPSFTTQPFPFSNLHGRIRAIYDAFGPERMIWGSDVTRLMSTYDENVRLFSEALDFLSDDDKEWIFCRALSRQCDVRL